MKIFFGMLLAVGLLVIVCGSISLWINNSWAADYLVIVIAGSVVALSASVLMVLIHNENLNRDLENADTANMEFRD